MLFIHEENAHQFDHFSYGNLGVESNNQCSSCTEMNLRGTSSNPHEKGLVKENIYGKYEESSFGNSFKDSSTVSPENFSSSWLSEDDFQSAMLDNDKQPLFDTRPCQTASKRPKQASDNTWLYSFQERPSSNALEISASALTDEHVETKELDTVPTHIGTRTCNDSSGIPCPNQAQSIGLESSHLPDWVTSFPSYFEDWGLVCGHNKFDHIDSPVHEHLPRKDVPIGPDHQADIPEWRPRVSEIIRSCEDMACHTVSTSEFLPRDDSESDKWVMHSVIPMSTSSFDGVGKNKVHCECFDAGADSCVRRHILEARESLKMSLGHDKFQDLGLCEMGEDVAHRWTDDEEKRFRREVFANPISLGKNFWDYLPHAFPGKSSKELVSYYFNVFMLRKRAQQNRSDMLHVDSDDDELHDEPPLTEHRKEDSAVESPSCEQFINRSM